ncbi:UDP-glucose/GDP-mannose dehydrogenase family protein [Fictibacillus nanhaiensis]|uniref:UDP-glucose dehydrogenase family protein n=1 Tax=Fictibacillus nanhaiensis TaxID=742169 RepID=UPI001C94C8C2|nr:UDP-glucose/GDP-mannose dehydrogenase family protein [Fictibacillus nanhaiensis]MBY6035106.1 UDP-glucose/GDP-mannose dehydrogenase family protein [Fictibacillus nanhaiensis]
MKLGIFGVGYVGLVTAVCFADKGHDVYIHDTAKEKIATLQSGGLPIFEEGLEPLLQQNESKLHYTHNATAVIHDCDVIFICVGTPQDTEGNADLSQVESVVEIIGKESRRDKVIIIKSTVPPGSTENMEKLAQKQNKFGNRFTLVHNPEFLRQGKAVYDFMNPSKIVIGTSDSEAQKLLCSLYKKWNAPILVTDTKSAELLKYAANSFLAMKISYINMFSQLSDKLGTNIDDVAYGMGLDPRIGSDFLNTGIGFGGSCFPKDLKALENVAAGLNIELPFISQTTTINEKQGDLFYKKIKNFCKSLQNRKVTLLGLSFKPFTEDTRSAPSLLLSQKLVQEGAIVTAYDPLVRDFPVEGVHIVSSLEAAIKDSEMVCLVTEWPEFKKLLHGDVLKLMNEPVIFDGRNMFTLEEINRASWYTPLHYESIGRPTVTSYTDNNQAANLLVKEKD